MGFFDPAAGSFESPPVANSRVRRGVNRWKVARNGHCRSQHRQPELFATGLPVIRQAHDDFENSRHARTQGRPYPYSSNPSCRKPMRVTFLRGERLL